MGPHNNDLFMSNYISVLISSNHHKCSVIMLPKIFITYRLRVAASFLVELASTFSADNVKVYKLQFLQKGNERYQSGFLSCAKSLYQNDSISQVIPNVLSGHSVINRGQQESRF